ncbi:MAG: spore protease YyaC [Clostridia bacterium]|nr:spore protease YyaC [Clostridia bacterium]
MNPLKSYATNSKPNNSFRIHMDEPFAVFELSNEINNFFQSSSKKDCPIILCIGTDRATGDSLGPLTGWKLKSLLSDSNIEILGTIDYPVHAKNLSSVLSNLSDKIHTHPLIAIDACLGHVSSVGNVVFTNGPIKPGTAVKKSLPEVGDIGITGIVNVGGFMEFQVLQNTRLSVVFKMSNLIANSLFLSLTQQIKKTGSL